MAPYSVTNTHIQSQIPIFSHVTEYGIRDWIWSCVTEFGHAWLNLVTRDWIWSRVRSIHKWRVWDFGHLQLPPWAQRPSGPLEAKRCLNCVSWRADPGSEGHIFVREIFLKKMKKVERCWILTRDSRLLNLIQSFTILLPVHLLALLAVHVYHSPIWDANWPAEQAYWPKIRALARHESERGPQIN